MIKAIIVDDEPLAISVIKEHLRSHPEIRLVAECLNGFEAIKAINAEKPDLLFLDIQMPRITGLELLELVDPAPAVIFITAFHEHAIQAFEKQAVDYLLKPVSKERFDQAIEKVMRRSHKELDLPALIRESSETTDRIVIRNGNNIRVIPLDEIYAIEASDDYVKISLEKESFQKKQTLTSLEALLPHQEFLRVHRSFIVRIKMIIKVEPLGKESYIAVLKNGMKINLSRTGYLRLKEALHI